MDFCEVMGRASILCLFSSNSVPTIKNLLKYYLMKGNCWFSKITIQDYHLVLAIVSYISKGISEQYNKL